MLAVAADDQDAVVDHHGSVAMTCRRHAGLLPPRALARVILFHTPGIERLSPIADVTADRIQFAVESHGCKPAARHLKGGTALPFLRGYIKDIHRGQVFF